MAYRNNGFAYCDRYIGQ